MKKKDILFLVFFAIVILAAFTLSFVKPGNNITGYLVMKAGEKPPYDFYFLIAAIALVVAISTYIYSIRKFGPA